MAGVTHLGIFHGWNVQDKGLATTDRIHPYAIRRGYVVHDFDYAPENKQLIKWIDLRWLFDLRESNEEVVRRLLPIIKDHPGMILMGHSNAALIIWMLVQAGAPVGGVVLLQPALRRDARWPIGLPVLCTYSTGDKTVLFGRAWARFATRLRPWKGRHGWGAAGYYGLDQASIRGDVKNINLSPLRHSEIFAEGEIEKWMPRVMAWIHNVEQRVEA